MVYALEDVEANVHGYSPMTFPPPDASRDRRIEDPTNLWLIHPLARALLPGALRLRVSANMVSLVGFSSGIAAAALYGMPPAPMLLAVALACSVFWLVCDGLDGMIARATNSSSALGRILDGVCDHAVFVLTYLSLALLVDRPEGWALAWIAGAAHAVQSSVYEGERARYHRRAAGLPPSGTVRSGGNFVVRFYDLVANLVEKLSPGIDRLFTHRGDNRQIAAAYAERAAGPMRLMILLTANTRVWAIFAACALGDPMLFWWFELVPLSLVAVAGLAWHRKVEADLTHRFDPEGIVPFEPAVRSRPLPKDFTH
jgi:phosphatidylglycerophosphate synthase